MKPALTSVLTRSRISSDCQSLFTAIGKVDQILLKRKYAKRIFYRKCLDASVLRFCLHKIVVALAKEARFMAEAFECCVVEPPSTVVEFAGRIARLWCVPFQPWFLWHGRSCMPLRPHSLQVLWGYWLRIIG